MRSIRNRWWTRWRRRWSNGAATGSNNDLGNDLTRTEIHFLCHADGVRSDGGIPDPAAESSGGPAAAAGDAGAGGHRGDDCNRASDGDVVRAERSGRLADDGGAEYSDASR